MGDTNMLEHPGRPDKVEWIEKEKCSRLFWGNAGYKFDMRGGLAWPRIATDEATGTLRGFVVLTGLDIERGVIYIFEEMGFSAVVSGVYGGTYYSGLRDFLSTAWTHYFARRLVVKKGDRAHWTYARQVAKSTLIQPKPAFRSIAYDDAYAWGQAVKAFSTEKLIGFEGSDLEVASNEYAVQGNDMPVEIEALCCAVMDFEIRPNKGA